MKYSELLKKPSFIRKIQNVIAKQNSGISRIFDKTAAQKEIWLYIANSWTKLISWEYLQQEDRWKDGKERTKWSWKVDRAKLTHQEGFGSNRGFAYLTTRWCKDYTSSCYYWWAAQVWISPLAMIGTISAISVFLLQVSLADMT